jgi:hypothetical protein
VIDAQLVQMQRHRRAVLSARHAGHNTTAIQTRKDLAAPGFA